MTPSLEVVSAFVPPEKSRGESLRVKARSCSALHDSLGLPKLSPMEQNVKPAQLKSHNFCDKDRYQVSPPSESLHLFLSNRKVGVGFLMPFSR